MIEVKIDPHAYTMHLQGHAGYDEPGRDIVCAAASMLALTLAYRCRGVAEPDEIAEEELLNGNAHVVIKPNTGREAQYHEIFSTIHAGFEALSGKYPQCVKLT